MKNHIGQWAVGRESRVSTYFAVLFGTAVLSILAIRGMLAATGYPQLGNDSFHIAHMLWGGLFMLVATIVLLYVHGHRAKVFGSFLAGVGFGFFIDELGKFITKDNDYFYQPTAMLIYLIFLLLWALLSWLDNYVPSTERQKFVDLLTRTRDVSIHGMSDSDKQTIIRLFEELHMSQQQQKVILGAVETYAPKYHPDGVVQLINATLLRAERSMEFVIRNRVTPFLIYVATTVAAVTSLLLLLSTIAGSQNFFDIYTDVPTFIEIGLMFTTLLTIVCVIFGFSYVNRKWRMALVWYRRALLVNIFGTQVFLFYINQFTAAFGFLASLLFLYILSVLLAQYDIHKKLS